MSDDHDEGFDLSGFNPSASEASRWLARLVRASRRTNRLLERRIAPALERIAAALESGAAVGPAPRAASAASVDELRARLDASRSANDPESVLVLRDELAAQLPAEAIAELDREVVHWLILLIQRRMRTGTVRADVVHLADRVARRFGTTLEGASLRASLPTLRRSAGLCPSCGEPYTGLEDVCPTCQAARQASATAEAAPPPGSAAEHDAPEPEPTA
jgi:hypothetical protein